LHCASLRFCYEATDAVSIGGCISARHCAGGRGAVVARRARFSPAPRWRDATNCAHARRQSFTPFLPVGHYVMIVPNTSKATWAMCSITSALCRR
jgi:hypothetical protein